MIEFKISAPGRITLSGEYAAIYGKKVVITTLNRRTTLQFTELINNSRGICKIEFPDVDLSLNLPLELVENFLSSNTIIRMNRIRLFKYVQYFITSNGMWSTYKQRFSLQMFFFTLFYIVHREQFNIKSFYVHVTSEIPMKARLGSSTSFAICLAACFLHWSCLQRGDHNEFSMEELGIIGASAMYCRKGTRSSRYLLDSAVGLYGNVATIYELLGYLHHNRLTFSMPKMRVLLINSTIRQNKYEEIEHVAQLKCFYPEFTDRHLNNINKISRIISEKLYEMAISQSNNNLQALISQFIILKILVLLNQDALSELNLSNSILNNIFYIAHVYGYGSMGKLTGDGKKKFVCIFLRPDISEEQIDNISAHLESYEFPVMVTSISCDGVRIED